MAVSKDNVRISITIPKTKEKELKKKAKDQGKTVSAIAANAVIKYA